MKDYSKIFWISAVILIIIAFFLAKIPMNPDIAPLSGLFIILLALPSYYAVYRWLGLKKSILVLFILSIYAILIETLALITGFPYSPFHYNHLIGYQIGDYTPYTVPFAYVPIFLGCLYLASIKTSNKIIFILYSGFFVLITDLMLDPAAVALNFWTYQTSGMFYGVPLMNFLGWIITGGIASLISLILVNDIFEDKPRAMVSSLFMILVFWSGVCIFLELYIPGIIGIILFGYVLWETRFKVGEF
ncbi:MAG: carotenoid biosynthesis protein [Methanobacterium sp.]|nr:carotenoid biosynthesis protein [Methanobacterium sp.]